MPRLLYSLLCILLLPLVLLRLWRKGARQPGYRQHLGERFGHYDQAKGVPVIWLHAVSVGETRAAQPLVKALQIKYPTARILLTHMTPTGRETSEQIFGKSVWRVYLPYDYPRAVGRFLTHFQPSMGIIMETELWPNLVAACHQRNIPLVLANARLSERSAASYARFATLTRQMMGQLSAVLAQTEADADRLATLGAVRPKVMGNIKFDILPPPDMLSVGAGLRRLIGPRAVLLAASTRDGEEELILDALVRAPLPGALLLMVPRHPERFGVVENLVRARGLRLQRRSENHAVAAETEVLLGDSMGEMFAYYAACNLAFIGGSLLPLGGQNLIEACAVGKPVLIGPHTFNFLDATHEAIAVGAALRVKDADELISLSRVLLSNANAREAMGEAGKQFSATHRGATARTMEVIAGLMSDIGQASPGTQQPPGTH